MVIKIPSKNIYDINNSKVKDNIIEKISSQESTVVPDVKLNVPVATETLYDVDLSPSPPDVVIEKNRIWEGEFSSGNSLYSFAVSCIVCNQSYTYTTLEIPIVKNNSYSSSLKFGADENGKPNIKVLIKGKISKGTSTATIVADITYSDFVVDIGELNYSINETKDSQFNFENDVIEYTSSSGKSIATAQVKLDLGNLLTEVPGYKEENGIEYHIIDLKILSELEVYKIGVGDFKQEGVYRYSATGEYEKYTPESLEITIYGNTYGISLEEKTISYGNGNKLYYLNGNELVQENAKYHGEKVVKHLSDNIISQYSKGKETSTLLCGMSDYKDYNTDQLWISTKGFIKADNIVNVEKQVISYFPPRAIFRIQISSSLPFDLPIKLIYSSELEEYLTISRGSFYVDSLPFSSDYDLTIISVFAKFPMCFDIGYKVIPMVCGADGNDYPMSKYQNGQPKIFEVCGTEMIYDGAVWQKLHLQEYNE